MGMKYEIECVKTKAALDEVMALDGALDEDMERFLPGFFDPGSSARSYEDFLNGVRGVAFLARIDGAAVGMARCALGPFAVLESLFVREDCRGNGIGKALLSATREAAKAHGKKVMFLNVMIGNDRARSLYENEGFAAFRTTMITEL